MDPVTGAALIGGAASLGGGILGNSQNAANSAKANAITERTAYDQMNFQRAMSNTAYQRSKYDLEQAGMNPMLAYMNGGASTPSGASATGQAAHAENVVGQAVSSALETRRLQKELKAVDSQAALNDAQAQTQAAQTKLNEANATVAMKNAKALDTVQPTLEAKSRLEKKSSEIDEKALGYDAIMKRVGQATGIIHDATSAFMPKVRIEKGPTNYNGPILKQRVP